MSQEPQLASPHGTERFPTDPTGLPDATRSAVLHVPDGGSIDLRVAPVAKRLGDGPVRMLAYNGSIPGPTLVVDQGSRISVDVHNAGDLDTTVHWHGLRLQNRYDGVPLETQTPIPVGGEFSYRLDFPDPGLYWYHPHVREDYAQELGLYGNILVRPTDEEYWPAVDRELVLTLDDILLEDGQVAAFSPTETTHAAMGRFGNVLLTGGEPHPRLTARPGEVVRLWLTNTAGARVFDIRLPGATMKLVGGDSGRVEHEEILDRVLLAPSERAVVDVLLDGPGEVLLEHHTPRRSSPLATIAVQGQRIASPSASQFENLRRAPELAAERARLAESVAAVPDKVLALVAEMDDLSGHEHASGHAVGPPSTYTCPMHPDVIDDQPGRCPKCGMKLVAADPSTHHAGHHGAAHQAPEDAQADPHSERASGGIEWEDDMLEVNRLTTSANTRWKLLEQTDDGPHEPTGWRFTVGDRVKIRLVNEMESDHPMHHPFHLHGAGRFLVLARDGAVEPNLVWKDSVLIRAGETVDILFEVSNPGTWMAHCHIAEHMQSGMMFSFTVEP